MPSLFEPFGNVVMEAMASGCVVIGYHGRGGKEYFQRSFSYPIEAGDIVGFAKAVESVLAREKESRGQLERPGGGPGRRHAPVHVAGAT